MRGLVVRGAVIKVGAGLLAVLMLGACSSLPPSQSAVGRVTSEAQFFTLTGRLSIRQNDRLDSVKIVWSKDAREERLKFFTPFGSQLAELVKITPDGGRAEITLNNGNQITRAVSIDELTESVLGVALEVDQIARWIQGTGLTEDLPQDIRLRDGSVWQVTAERFQNAQDIYRYAARISAVKGAHTAVGAQFVAGDISLRLVVDEWRAQ